MAWVGLSKLAILGAGLAWKSAAAAEVEAPETGPCSSTSVQAANMSNSLFKVEVLSAWHEDL